MLAPGHTASHACVAVFARADSLHADDVSTFAIPGDLSETHSIDAGYTLLQQNVTRVCLAYADPACVAQRGGDACVIALVDQILASESSGGGGHPLATIVAPVAIAGGNRAIGSSAYEAYLFRLLKIVLQYVSSSTA